MPGGRLTDQDRADIAAGLAEGLGYAEIARRLRRPTSTISREVARNGGPAGFHAGEAHEATARRARRRRTPAPVRSEVVDADGRDLAVVREFVEEFAALMAETGVARMSARVLTCLFATDAGALTAADLVRRLQVSPASISKAVTYLEELDLVRRERDPRGRRDLYCVDDDVWVRAWMASARKNTTWADAAVRGVAILGPTTPAGARLANMGEFFRQLSQDMAGSSGAPTVDDALTVLAALVHAGMPLTGPQLAAALDWPDDRVHNAVREAERHPDVTDPVVLRRVSPRMYTVGPRLDRLSATQREALRHPVVSGPATGDGY